MCGIGECKCTVCNCKETKKFYQLFKEGKAKAEEIDDYIEKWHNGDSTNGDLTEELHEFLGMTDEEFNIWVETGEL